MNIHKANIMRQKGVKKMYAYSEDSVIAEPEILVDNSGEEPTHELVEECIKALHSIGYGIGATPTEISAQHVSFAA